MTTKTQRQNAAITRAMAGQKAASTRRPTAKERMTGGIGVPAPAPKPAPKGRKPRTVNLDAGTPKGERPLGGKPKAPKPQPKPKTPRVLADPVDNAKLIRMRAKWAAIREDRRAAKVEEKYGETSPEAAGARELVDAAWAEERQAYKAYRELLEARKVEQKAEAK
jgi:hypothetical protein